MVGYQSLVTWQPEQNLRLDLALWYPTQKSPKDLNIGGWAFSAARNAAPASGSFPLILLSHDSFGSRYSYHHLAVSLAAQGYIVAAPQHEGDNMDDMRLLFSYRQWPVRANQIRAALDLVLQNEAMKAVINPQRIAYLGFGIGGSAALLLAEAQMDSKAWPAFCDTPGSPYCQPFIRSTIDRLCLGLDKARQDYSLALLDHERQTKQLRQEYTDAMNKWNKEVARLRKAAERRKQALELPPEPQAPQWPVLPKSLEILPDARISAYIFVAPGLSMLWEASSLVSINKPVLLIEAGMDTLNFGQARILRGMLPQAMLSLMDNTDAPGFMAPCPAAIAQDLPDMCNTVSLKERTQIMSQLFLEISRFLQHFLP